uniref:Cyclic nucleotide-binding domain-containing protein n=1 Tax=Heterosigma akashiwo TaxID=2829 RepID=A0A7S4D7F7_HETAK
MDILTSIPVNCLTLIVTSAGSSANVSTLHILKLLRISKLSRLLNARRTVREIEALSSNPAVVRMMKIFLIFIGVSHYLGCTTHYFICTLNGGFDPNTEIFQDRCSNYGDLKERYTSSWLLSIKAIYGSVESGHTIEEQRMEMFILIIGLGVSSTIIGGLSSLLGSLDRTQAAKNEELDNVKEFCRRMKVPVDLRQRMLGYFNYVWEIGSSLYLQQVYEQLPPRLCLELRLRLNRGFVRQCPLLSVFPGPAVAAMVEGMEAVIVMPDDPIVQQGQAVSQFFLISRGRCGVSHQEPAAPSKRRPPPLPETPSSPTLGQGVGAFLAQGGPGHGRAAALARQQSGLDPAGGRLHKLSTLLSGSHFGDHQVLGLEEKSSVNVISEVYGELQVVPGDILISVLDADPLLKATMMQISKNTLAAQMAMLRDLLKQPGRKNSSFHPTEFIRDKTATRSSGHSAFKNPNPDKTLARIDFQADAVKRWKLVQAACKVTNFDLEKNKNDQATSLDRYINDKVTHYPRLPAVFHSKVAHHVQEDRGRGSSSCLLDLNVNNNSSKQNSCLDISKECLEEEDDSGYSTTEQRQEKLESCSQTSQQVLSSSCQNRGGSLKQKDKIQMN